MGCCCGCWGFVMFEKFELEFVWFIGGAGCCFERFCEDRLAAKSPKFPKGSKLSSCFLMSGWLEPLGIEGWLIDVALRIGAERPLPEKNERGVDHCQKKGSSILFRNFSIIFNLRKGSKKNWNFPDLVWPTHPSLLTQKIWEKNNCFFF